MIAIPPYINVHMFPGSLLQSYFSDSSAVGKPNLLDMLLEDPVKLLSVDMLGNADLPVSDFIELLAVAMARPDVRNEMLHLVTAYAYRPLMLDAAAAAGWYIVFSASGHILRITPFNWWRKLYAFLTKDIF